METQKCEFFSKKLEIDEIEFCPYPEFPYAEKRNRPGFVNISSTLVIDTSTERSSSTTTWEPNFFFFKKVRNWIWLVLKTWNQHSSRSHLYVDIGDASSSLWGSTSSYDLISADLCAVHELSVCTHRERQRVRVTTHARVKIWCVHTGTVRATNIKQKRIVVRFHLLWPVIVVAP